MSQLGIMMVRAGLLAESQATAATEHAADHGMSIVDAVLELSLADEDALVAFFGSKLNIPRVRKAVLDRVEDRVAARIPPDLAWEHLIMPVSVDATGNLTLAMVDPTMVDAVQQVSQSTKRYVVRAVAGATELRNALAAQYGPRERWIAVDPNTTQPAIHVSEEERSLGREPAAPEAEMPPDAPEAVPAWNPPLSGQEAEPVPLSPEAFNRALPRLVTANDRDEITRLLLDFLGAGFDRVILFVHSRGELRGHDARGADLLVEAVRQVRIPSEGPSMFATAIETLAPYFGPMRDTSDVDRAMARALGGVRGNVLILPISIAKKVPLLVFALGTTKPVDPRSIGELTEGVSNALHRLITARRG